MDLLYKQLADVVRQVALFGQQMLLQLEPEQSEGLIINCMDYDHSITMLTLIHLPILNQVVATSDISKLDSLDLSEVAEAIQIGRSILTFGSSREENTIDAATISKQVDLDTVKLCIVHLKVMFEQSKGAYAKLPIRPHRHFCLIN